MDLECFADALGFNAVNNIRRRFFSGIFLLSGEQ